MTKLKIWIPLFLLVAVVAVGFKNTDNTWKVGDGINGNVKEIHLGPNGRVKWDGTKVTFSDDAGSREESIPKMYGVIIDNNGANCVIVASSEVNDWITSVNRNGQGDCTINTSVTATRWICTCSGAVSETLCAISTSTTSLNFITYVETATDMGPADRVGTQVICLRASP